MEFTNIAMAVKAGGDLKVESGHGGFVAKLSTPDSGKYGSSSYVYGTTKTGSGSTVLIALLELDATLAEG